MAGIILQTENLTMHFGGLAAVSGLDLEVEAGEIRGIIGPNGSGKTTTINLVSGLYRPTTGSIRLAGERVEGLPPYMLVQRGIARTFQNIRLFPSLPVLANVMVGQFCRTRAGLLATLVGARPARREEEEAAAQALATLEFLGLGGLAAAFPQDLPYGQRRLVEIARALVSRPRLLLLDEPAAGLSSQEKESLMEALRRINREMGLTLIIIEHDLGVIGDLCHTVTVLNSGVKIAEGPLSAVREDPAVVEAYLGRGSRHGALR